MARIQTWIIAFLASLVLVGARLAQIRVLCESAILPWHDCGGDALYSFAACRFTDVTFTPANCSSSPLAVIAGRPSFQATGSAETSWKS